MKRSAAWSRIYPRAVSASKAFSLLEPGDRVLVALSGGADSLALLDILDQLRERLGSRYGLGMVAGHVRGSYRGRTVADVRKLEKICAGLGIELRLSEKALRPDVFADCFRCSRARRRLLFDLAEETGCNKVALGHNADDLVETFLMNIFYSGRLAALSPRQAVLKGKLCFIRPLIFAWKEDISRYAMARYGRLQKFNCTGSRNSQRLAIRKLLARLSKQNTHLKANLLKAITNPRLDYLPVPRR